MAASWILKTEPSTYAWQDLVREGHTVWSGVANAAALIHLRAMRRGDEALIYHSNDGKAIVGIARITRGGYPDPALDDPRRVVVDVEPVRALAEPVTLAQLKAVPALATLDLVRISRLSCSPVSPAHRAILRSLGVK
ncbi:MAG TPA: EVE domain-containing protein [Gemmatimonadales bacterium]|jgi:predicted RNA-binding protein with PUA-like domain